MSVTHVPAPMRRLVRQRAGNRCEYCGIHEDDTEFGCEVAHIISEKHLGRTDPDNLALTCFFCNRNKGADLGSMRSANDLVLVRFFNPRSDSWDDHFGFDDTLHVIPKTDIGRVTARVRAVLTQNTAYWRGRRFAGSNGRIIRSLAAPSLASRPLLRQLAGSMREEI